MSRVLRVSALVVAFLLAGGTILAIAWPRSPNDSGTEPWVSQPPHPAPTEAPDPTPTPTDSLDSPGGTSSGPGNQGSNKADEHRHGGSVDPPEPGHGRGHR